MTRRERSEPRSILLLRTSALGDVVHCLPVASALRRAFPAARIGWVVEEPFLPLVASHPAVDDAIPVALRRWRRRPLAASTRDELDLFLDRLHEFHADVALDLMGNHKAGALAWLSRARRKIGAARGDRRERSSAFWLRERVPLAGVHAVDRALSLLAPLGVAASPADFAGASLLPGGAPPAEPADVLVQPGAGWGNKRYPVPWWADVARALARDGHRVGVLAGPGEEPLARAVADAAVVPRGGSPVRALVPADLAALAATMRAARLLLGGDTGPLHLAHALGTPVLALHGPTDPTRHGPYAAADRAMVKVLPCSFCYKRFAEAKACLLELSPPHVVSRARSLLSSA